MAAFFFAIMLAALASLGQSSVIHVGCSEPMVPQYGGYYPQKNYHIGSTVDFYCNEGYELQGTSWTVCIYDAKTGTGSWIHPPPICKPKVVQCPDLYSPKHGTVHISGNTPGSRADYTCDSGFKLEGVAWRKCLESGKWSGQAPVCQRIACPDLDEPEYGSVKVSGTAPGSRADYRCDDGFMLEGMAWRKCLENGEWSGMAPVCQRITCPDLDDPEYGSVKVNGNTPGSRADYTCDSGFSLKGVAWRKCLENGEWSGQAPLCESITCPDLDAPADGDIEVDSNTPGSSAKYTCNSGFVLDGESSRNCQDNGEWSGEAPMCKRITCPDLDEPDYGSVKISGTAPGSRADYRCDDGFMLEGVAWRKCLESGEWSGMAPVCKRITCPDLDEPEYGSVKVNGNMPGSRADYTCDSGFNLKGVAWRMCLESGEWSGQAPVCERISCPDLDAPTDGDVEVDGNKPGSSAKYTCNSGFVLDGESSRNCQDNGEWSGEVPTCKRITCPDLNEPDYGSVKVSSNIPGSRADYTCDSGFKLEGVAWRKCLENGEWSGMTPVCKRITCPDLDEPEYGSVKFSGNTPGSRADYTCDSGFKLEGVAWRKCLESGKWSGQAPVCQRITCSDLDEPEYGSVKVSGTAPGSRADYRCDDGFMLEGVAWRKCLENGEWSGEAPVCQRIACPDLDDPEYGSVKVNGNTPGSLADYTCDSGFNLEGVAWRKCLDNGQWSGQAPVCQVAGCREPPKPDHGWVFFKSTAVGSKAYYACKFGYKLKGYGIRVCQDSGLWAGNTPECHHYLYSFLHGDD